MICISLGTTGFIKPASQNAIRSIQLIFTNCKIRTQFLVKEKENSTSETYFAPVDIKSRWHLIICFLATPYSWWFFHFWIILKLFHIFSSVLLNTFLYFYLFALVGVASMWSNSICCLQPGITVHIPGLISCAEKLRQIWPTKFGKLQSSKTKKSMSQAGDSSLFVCCNLAKPERKCNFWWQLWNCCSWLISCTKHLTTNLAKIMNKDGWVAVYRYGVLWN